MTVEIAIAALVRDGRLLLGHRHPERRWYPDCWDLIGGHIERGEEPLDAVRRECLEEIDVEISELRPVEVNLADPNLCAHAFLVTGWTGEPTNVAPEEHDALSWFGPDEIADLRLADPSYPLWFPRLIAEARADP